MIVAFMLITSNHFFGDRKLAMKHHETIKRHRKRQSRSPIPKRRSGRSGDWCVCQKPSFWTAREVWSQEWVGADVVAHPYFVSWVIGYRWYVSWIALPIDHWIVQFSSMMEQIYCIIIIIRYNSYVYTVWCVCKAVVILWKLHQVP